MIIEMLIGAGIVAAGAAVTRIIVRRRAANAKPEDDAKPSSGEKEKKPKKQRRKDEAKAAPLREGPRGLRVGDVLLYADSELWLAGCLELDEEGFVARVFVCPGGERAEYVVQLDSDANDLVMAASTDEVPDGVVPESLPIGGRRLRLESRGVADVRREGEHLPRSTERANYAILADVGGRTLLVVDFVKGRRLALVGDRVGRHMLDLLPGGDLEDR
ncbi:MAG: hypothetical protein H6719_22850 [Sandaracinaceae bacterium]|nr:hypothetical protein [Sandaracinaceae bacterium]